VLEIQSYEEGPNKIAVFTVKLTVSRNSMGYRYKQKPLEIGSTIDLLLNNTRVGGNVMDIRDSNKQEVVGGKHKKLKVRLYKRRPWFAKKIKVGDKKFGVGGDRVQVEVLAKKVGLSEESVPTARGLMLTGNPMYRDIELELKLLVSDRGGVTYFANYQPIKVGNKLYIPMEDYNLYEAEVMGVE